MQVSITEAKAKLSALIAAAERGAEVIITRRGKAAHSDLVLDRGVPLQPGDGHEVQIKHGKLGQSGQVGLQADRALARIDAHREIVERDLHHAAPDLFRIMGMIGERLRVGQKQELLMAVLKAQSVAQGASVMADMERPRGAVAGQDDGFGGHG
ncbi:type II toxin-antitoxin system Phd/YefM family antitoxin [Roseovarius sp. M141]|nr:type II toxin-antitoxin system Phd/YefM family antitoxin [Roseovarius sp. M141]